MILTTPARVCLFGDHQDYLGLPIIACAINRYMTLQAYPNGKDFFEIHLPDMGRHRIIYFKEHLSGPLTASDFFLSGLKVIERHGCTPFAGYDITITSTIPINAGVSSSSALVVSWMHFLSKAFGTFSPTPENIAQLAYEAEVLEHHGPGGKMDQYSIALGDILYLETGDQLHYELFKKSLHDMVLVESGIPKETLGTLRNIRHLTQESVQAMADKQADFVLEKCTLEEATHLTDLLPKEQQEFFLAAVENHDITQKAYHHLQGEKWNQAYLGNLMYAHHRVLRDRLQVSHPTIDGYIEAGLELGAYGGKIVGSGGGGCAVLLCNPIVTESLVEKLLHCGAKAAYKIDVAKGTHGIY